MSDCLAEIVAAQAPRLFATVVTPEGGDTEVIAWGMSFNDSAYMISADGRNQFFLAEAEGALKYIRSVPGVTSELVWISRE
jgi:hypothetical protein